VSSFTWEAVAIDRDTSHNGKNNTYSLKLNGKKLTLLPMKHRVTPKTQKLDKTLLSIKLFIHDSLDSGCAYMLGADLCANNGGNEVEKNVGEVTSAIKELLQKFGGCTPMELPLGLSPMRDIQQKIQGANDKYKTRVDQKRRQLLFEEGDLVWVYLPKERKPGGPHSKLQDRKIGPCKILQKLKRQCI
jgi:hypothetical protein